MTFTDTVKNLRRPISRPLHPRDLDQKPLDINAIEGDIAETLRGLPALRDRQAADFAPKEAMPDYVEHREDVDQVGRLAAEAVVRQYEAAAKAVEAMHGDLRDLAAKAIKMLDQLI